MCMVCSIVLTGCDDFLTPDNKSSVTDTDYFSTASGFQSLVYDAYAQLIDIYNSTDVPVYFNSGTDLYHDGRNDIDAALHPNMVKSKLSIPIVMMEFVLVSPFNTMHRQQMSVTM